MSSIWSSDKESASFGEVAGKLKAQKKIDKQAWKGSMIDYFQQMFNFCWNRIISFNIC